jgi:two-component system, OmpR family, sensor histidine kinase KdpD
MKNQYMINVVHRKRHYVTAILTVIIVSALSYPFADVIGYRAVALLLLFTVSLLSLRMDLFPVLAGAAASALIWNFFFIPPHFTFHIGTMEDGLMFAMYFIVALLNGVFSARIRRAEKKMRQKEERARAAKLYDTIFNSLSHELRTPIASLLGASENLLTNKRLTEEMKQKLYSEIETSAERLNRLVDNLLNMSRLESGSIKPKWEWCDVNELLFSAVNRLDKELSNHKVGVNIPQNLPLVLLDFGLMEQALFNLLYNASIYTPDNSEIEITGNFEGQLCIITIADNGHGFPNDDMELVFGKFYRTKGSKSGGTGLGLSIVKGIVEAHDGTIKLENRPSGGAKFTIQIPTKGMNINNLEIDK